MFSNISNKIDYYNMYLNHTMNKLKDHFIKFLDSLTDIIEFNQYIKLVLIYYKLFNKYYKEEVHSEPYSTKAMSNYKLGNKIPYFAAYYSTNFHKFFNKRQNITEPEKKHPKNISKMSSQILFQAKDKNEPNNEKGAILKNLMKTNNNSKFIDLIIHLNLKFMSWKSSLIEQDCEIKCRICESNVQAKALVLHSYICTQIQEWRKKVSFLNENVKKLIVRTEKLMLNFHYKDLDLKITNSPVNDAYFSSLILTSNHKESYLFGPLLSNLEVTFSNSRNHLVLKRFVLLFNVF
jgi:hypothetical protein